MSASWCVDINLHLNVLAYMSVSWCVGIYAGFWTCQRFCQRKNQCVDIHVGILLTTSIMCRHLNVSAYMSGSWCVDIYVGIWTCQNLGHHKNKCVDIYVGMFSILLECADISMCWRICQHLDVSTYMSAFGYVNILASTRTNVLAYMSAYSSPLVECADISMCWHVCQHLNMPTSLCFCTCSLFSGCLRWHWMRLLWHPI